MKVLLYIGIIVSIITYLFWGFLPKGSFYVGNALFISLICAYIFFTDKKSRLKFILFGLSLNNLFDELFFDNTKLDINELIIGVSILLISVKFFNNDRQVSKHH